MSLSGYSVIVEELNCITTLNINPKFNIINYYQLSKVYPFEFQPNTHSCLAYSPFNTYICLNLVVDCITFPL